jgi:hypothetical protein
MAIYWILERKLTQADWMSPVEGYPGYFYSVCKNLKFLDISNLGIYQKLEKILYHPVVTNLFDINSIQQERYITITKRNINEFLKVNVKDAIFVFSSVWNGNNSAKPLNLFIRFLNLHGAKTILLAHWLVTYTQSSETGKRFLLQLLLSRKRMVLLYFFSKTIAFFQKRRKPYFDFLFSCGNKISEMMNEYAEFETVIPANSLSYDEYLIRQNNKIHQDVQSNFIVYIDQGITMHPDTYYCSKKDKNNFHKEIMEALDFFEDDFGSPIIIAAHPRVKYPAGYWGARKIIYGESYNLIDNSAGVLGHFSTICDYVYLRQKQITLLTSSNLYFTWDIFVRQFADTYCCDIYDMYTKKFIKAEHNSTHKINIKDYFSLVNSDKSNKELLFDFLKGYDK